MTKEQEIKVIAKAIAELAADIAEGDSPMRKGQVALIARHAAYLGTLVKGK